ncbi:MAG: UDP-glucose 4-epimerase GalE [Bacteroidota bacterium]
MSKILVTGGAGYIGSHTVVALMQAGYDVLIIDDLSNSEIRAIDGIKTITGKDPLFEQIDLTDREATAQCLRRHADINGIIHFAAKKAVGESVVRPLYYYRNNIDSMINLLELMGDNEIQHIVFSSSCTVYGQPDQLPVTEATPFKPAESPYGYTKQVCETILKDTCRAQDELCAIALRYFNPVGAHESALIGELPRGVPNNLVPYITQTAAGKRDTLKVFGDDYDTPDGSAIRDFIHVEDLAQAHVIAIDRLIRGKQKNNYEFFNLGTGKGYSVLEVVKTFEKVNGFKLDYEIKSRRSGDIVKIYADTTLANEELGWKARRTLEEMLKSSWAWEQSLG